MKPSGHFGGVPAVERSGRRTLINPVAAVISPDTATTSVVTSPMVAAVLLRRPPPDDAVALGVGCAAGDCTVTVTVDGGWAVKVAVGAMGGPGRYGNSVLRVGATSTVLVSWMVTVGVLARGDADPVPSPGRAAAISANKIAANAANESPTMIHRRPRPRSNDLGPSMRTIMNAPVRSGTRSPKIRVRKSAVARASSFDDACGN